MASLAEVYEGVGVVATRRQVYVGIGLFVIGSILGLAGLIVGSTQILAAFDIGVYGSRRIAGLLAGLGVPAILLGIFTVLPADRRVRAAAVIGAGITVLGVSAFWVVYPYHWAGYGRDLTLPVSAIYTFGMVVTLWSLFVAITTFKTRNDPGGTVRLEVTKDGVTRIIREAPSGGSGGSRGLSGGLGGVGVFGSTTTGSSGTTTSGSSDGATVTRSGRSTVSDGGAAEPQLHSPLDDDGAIMEPAPASPPAHVDTYCGNCAYFDYVRSGGGIKPHCGFNDEVMSDMTACDHWKPNQHD